MGKKIEERAMRRASEGLALRSTRFFLVADWFERLQRFFRFGCSRFVRRFAARSFVLRE